MIRSSARRGYGLIDLTIASLLIAVAVGIAAKSVVWVAAERRGAERRERAMQEAANLMERLAARPRDELTPALAESLTLSPATASALRDGSLEVAIGPAPGEPRAKVVSIVIRWVDSSGGLASPVRLVAFVHERPKS